MLCELFPKHIADQLKAGQRAEPEQHDEVTVVFSDVVHFTDISRTISPLKVKQMLDRLCPAFDKVASKASSVQGRGALEHELHIVISRTLCSTIPFFPLTIGDAYMGMTNLENDQDDAFVKNAALFAIDLVTEATKGYIQICVGFHSGAVVSNAIGSLNPRYGLFGDTVNTSSRMESNSRANRILCSEAAYHIMSCNNRLRRFRCNDVERFH